MILRIGCAPPDGFFSLFSLTIHNFQSPHPGVLASPHTPNEPTEVLPCHSVSSSSSPAPDVRSACGPASAGASSLSVFAPELSATASTAFGAANVEVGPKLNIGFGTSLFPAAAEGAENNGCEVAARGADAPKLKADVGGCEGVVEMASVLLVVPFAAALSVASLFAVPNPKAADVDRGLGAKLNIPGLPGVPGVPGAPVAVEPDVAPMLKENFGNVLGVVEAAADGVDGALNKNEDVPAEVGGDGTTIVSPIAGFTVGFIANMLDDFVLEDGVAGATFSAPFSFACSSITL